MELQSRLPDLRRNGLGIAAISYDPVPVLAEFATRRGITFPLLSDAGSAVIKAYGILNTSVLATNRQQYGIPYPGTFFLNRAGVVTSRTFEAAYQERTTVASALIRQGATMEAVRASVAKTAHLSVATFVSDAAAAPGTQFSLLFDVTPAPGMHVYAPGATGYRPVAVHIDPRPGLLVRGTRVPAAEIYHFKPLDERVAVFQKPFRIVQDLAIDPSPQASAALAGADSMTISGTLDYQACDDAICYNPQSIPLTWTVALKPLDRERAPR